MFEYSSDDILYNKEKLIKNIGITIKELRREKGISRYKLSNKLDISQTYIGFLEQGKYAMSLDKFILIVNELNVDADIVIRRAIEKTKEIGKKEIKDLNSIEEKDILKDIMNYLKEKNN